VTSTQPALPHIDTARFEPAVWDSFIQRWGELEAAYLIDPCVMQAESAFDTAHVTWVLVRINGRQWVKHCENATKVAEALFCEFHGLPLAAVLTIPTTISPCARGAG
jgi:hypothetical protein